MRGCGRMGGRVNLGNLGKMGGLGDAGKVGDLGGLRGLGNVCYLIYPVRGNSDSQ